VLLRTDPAGTGFWSNHTIYHWADPHAAEHDPALEHKAGFLNRPFFAIWTIITVVGWTLLGRKLRRLSTDIDKRPLSLEESKKYIWDNTVWAAAYAILFALTVLSSIPWFWLMSIDAIGTAPCTPGMCSPLPG
jgi:hypothetical protein